MGDYTVIEFIYLVSAVIGGTLFVLRTILMFTGIGGDHEAVHDHADHFGDAGHDAGSSFTFNLLSLQGLTAFFTMFGLVGLTLSRAGFHVLLTILGGTAAGLVTVLLISLIFSQVGRFQSEGTLDIKNAVGANGTVYLRIPPGGSGQVRVPVQGGLRILDAVVKGDEGLPTGTKIRVIGVADNATLIVEKSTQE
jgi:membrane protein implicated in regulation of membrane protease activity